MPALDSIDHELARVCERLDLLQHPFYRRWAAGELTRDQLSYYAGQYAHVVRAIPRWLEGAAKLDPAHAMALRQHAADETAHIAMWESFCGSLGLPKQTLDATEANPATTALLAVGDVLVQHGQGAAAVWSIEAQSPAVSREKLRGLRAYYGIDPTNGGQYFAVHEQLDVEHEAQLRTIMRENGQAAYAGAPHAATVTLQRMWDLLSSM